jgi:hypothetical protein
MLSYKPCGSSAVDVNDANILHYDVDIDDNVNEARISVGCVRRDDVVGQMVG